MGPNYEGQPCAKCGDGLRNVTSEQGPTCACPFCRALFHDGCMDGHHCEEMEQDGVDKLASWETAAQGWRRG